MTNRPVRLRGLTALATDRRRALAALLALSAFALAGCASIPKHDDPRLPVELSRTLGVPQSDFRWVAAVDWSQHEGWWQPGVGEDFVYRMLRVSRTGVLTDDALILARSGDFTVSYRVVQRIALADIERVTLLDDSVVVLKRRGSGELRDFVRVLRTDPWLNDLIMGTSPQLARELARELRARIPPAPPRWRPDAPARDVARTVALITPRAAPVVSFPPPPGTADKSAVEGTGMLAKGLLQAGEGIGTLSPAAGLPLGLAGIVVMAASSLAGAVQGTVREYSEPEPRAALARSEAVQRADLPAAAASVVANRILLESLSTRIAALEDARQLGDRSDLLVAFDEAEIAADIGSARAALAEDEFAFVWQLQVTKIELRVVTAGAEGPVADPQVAMHTGARLHKTHVRPTTDEARGAWTTELGDTGEALPLSVWAMDGGKRLHTEFRAACERLAAQLVEGEMANSVWLVRPR